MNDDTTTTPPLKELAAALAKAQATMAGAKKDAANPHFKSRYADLASVWDAIREPLTTNGLSVVQLLRSVQGGVEVETVLLHTSGESIGAVFGVPVTKADPQGYGSAATYARRYSLMALVGVAPEDDDGNAASAGDGGRDFAPRPPQRPAPGIGPVRGEEAPAPAAKAAPKPATSNDNKARAWTDKSIETLRVAGSSVEALDDWWRTNEAVAKGAKVSALGWLEQNAPAEYDRLTVAFTDLRDAAAVRAAA